MCTTCSRSGRSVEVDQVVLEPLGPGVGRGHLGLDLVVVDDPAGLGVHQEHLARRDAALLDHLGGFDVDHADLGGEDDQAVFGDPVPAGAQPVAVQGGADQVAVGEGHGGGAVPRFHQQRVVLVERAACRVHGGVVFPGLRDHHHDRVRDGAAGEPQQLRDLVEGRRVGGARGADGVQLFGESPSSGLASWDWRARIQFRLPLTVLISPLCAMVRNGWASGQDGKVLVEKREWTIASLVLKRLSERSG